MLLGWALSLHCAEIIKANQTLAHFPLHLPKNIEISICVCGSGSGSSTTSFASKFSQFKAKNPIIISLLNRIETLTRTIHQTFLHSHYTLHDLLPPLSEQLLQAYSELSQEVGIEIVPEVIRRKCLHFLHNEKSVLCAGIAGAGGFATACFLHHLRCFYQAVAISFLCMNKI